MPTKALISVVGPATEYFQVSKILLLSGKKDTGMLLVGY